MHLEDDVASLLDHARVAVPVYDAGLVRRDPAEAGAPAGVFALAADLRPRLLSKGDDVMDDAAIARPDLHGLNPLVFGEIGGHREIEVGHCAVSRDCVLL